MSAKTGTAPTWSTAWAVAMNESAGTMTSAPGPAPAAASAMPSAAVPLFVARQNRAPTKAANSASRARISGAPPPPSPPPPSTRPTASRSAAVRRGQRRGSTVLPPAPRLREIASRVPLHVVQEELDLILECADPDTQRVLEEARQVRHGPDLPDPLGELGHPHEVEHERGGQHRVAALPDELHAHRGVEEAAEVDEVPRGLPVPEGGHILDGDGGMRSVAQGRREHPGLAPELRLLVAWIGEHVAVAAAEEIHPFPGQHLEVSIAEERSEDRLHQRLARLAVGSVEDHAACLAQLTQRRGRDAGRRSEVDVGAPPLEGRVGVEHARRHQLPPVLAQEPAEAPETRVLGPHCDRSLRGGHVDHDDGAEALVLAEALEVIPEP